jgi:hypothetical protein
MAAIGRDQLPECGGIEMQLSCIVAKAYTYLCSYADNLIPEALQKGDHAKAMFHIA